MKNILVTALSLYRDGASEMTYTYRHHAVLGAQTNEPVVRLLAELLAEREEKLEQIIALCTPAVLESGSYDAFCRMAGVPCSCVLLEELPSSESIFRAGSEIVSLVGGAARVYLDSTGGFRDAMMAVIAAMQMLKEREIQVEDVFYCVFDRNRKPPYPIVSRKDTYAVYDLVSGIDELRQYGSVSKLNRYFEGRMLPPEQKRILEVLGEVYEEMQLCRPEQSRDAILRLNQLLCRFPGGEDPAFRAVLETAEAKYAGLDERMGHLDYMKWYFSNGYIAQTLAYFYETLPDLLVEHRIIYADPAEVEKHLDKSASVVDRRGWNYFFINQYFRNVRNPGKRLLTAARQEVEAIGAGEAASLSETGMKLQRALHLVERIRTEKKNALKAKPEYRWLLESMRRAESGTLVQESDLFSRSGTQSICNVIATNPRLIRQLYGLADEREMDDAALAELILSEVDGTTVFLGDQVEPEALQTVLEDYFYLKRQRNRVLHVNDHGESPACLKARLEEAINRVEDLLK